ncbi:biliverdin-producing heme oxygenase [Motilibacter aurantiacus]|uniref:biliverdin-producing heme oxygenase n=1 Tax=Motilibacter aurantiacus TaxID=2714955 RepID=UPI00140951E5|nr:biliverdin-producing heme oxygenase [Motilibacter aurantiacus]NHC45148.1 biliverdin-producing heme oxygenase [Motilibacter aurantiacus]
MTATRTEAGSDTAFSTRLRERTREGHAGAEHSGYMSALTSGQLPLEGYAALAAQQHAVYAVLEEAGDAMRADPVAGLFVADELRRLGALEADLAFLLGPRWREAATPTAATRDYCDRLREVCFDWPAGFVAHHYTRYLGDLSGGQIIGSLVARTYSLDEDGVRFYRFEGIPKPKAFKDRYRALLDAAPWDAQEQERVIDEVLVAYDHNTRMLASLDDVARALLQR